MLFRYIHTSIKWRPCTQPDQCIPTDGAYIDQMTTTLPPIILIMGHNSVSTFSLIWQVFPEMQISYFAIPLLLSG